MNEETAWLLEADDLTYLCVVNGNFTFLSDKLKALHFARKEDAEAMTEVYQPTRAVEHYVE